MAEVEGDGAGAALPGGGAASAADEEVQQWGPFADARSAVIGARCLKVLGWVHDVACHATRRGDSIGFTLMRALHASGGPVQLLASPQQQEQNSDAVVRCTLMMARKEGDKRLADDVHGTALPCLVHLRAIDHHRMKSAAAHHDSDDETDVGDDDCARWMAESEPLFCEAILAIKTAVVLSGPQDESLGARVNRINQVMPKLTASEAAMKSVLHGTGVQSCEDTILGPNDDEARWVALAEAYQQRRIRLLEWATKMDLDSRTTLAKNLLAESDFEQAVMAYLNKREPRMPTADLFTTKFYIDQTVAKGASPASDQPDPTHTPHAEDTPANDSWADAEDESVEAMSTLKRRAVPINTGASSFAGSATVSDSASLSTRAPASKKRKVIRRERDAEGTFTAAAALASETVVESAPASKATLSHKATSSQGDAARIQRDEAASMDGLGSAKSQTTKKDVRPDKDAVVSRDGGIVSSQQNAGAAVGIGTTAQEATKSGIASASNKSVPEGALTPAEGARLEDETEQQQEEEEEQEDKEEDESSDGDAGKSAAQRHGSNPTSPQPTNDVGVEVDHTRRWTPQKVSVNGKQTDKRETPSQKETVHAATVAATATASITTEPQKTVAFVDETPSSGSSDVSLRDAIKRTSASNGGPNGGPGSQGGESGPAQMQHGSSVGEDSDDSSGLIHSVSQQKALKFDDDSDEDDVDDEVSLLSCDTTANANSKSNTDGVGDASTTATPAATSTPLSGMAGAGAAAGGRAPPASTLAADAKRRRVDIYQMPDTDEGCTQELMLPASQVPW